VLCRFGDFPIRVSIAPTGLGDSITFVIPGCRAARFTLGYFILRFQRDEVVCGGKSCAHPDYRMVNHVKPSLTVGLVPPVRSA
jgi:hypothetical protein